MIGYEGARLCRIEKTLVGKSSSSSDNVAPPMTLNCAGGDSSESCWQWTVLFDLSIPGWLPASVGIDEFTETSYSLHAFATLETLEPPTHSPSSRSLASKSTLQRSKSAGKSSAWSLGSFPSLFSSTFSRSKAQKITAPLIPILINRVLAPRSIHETGRAPGNTSLFPMAHEQGSPLVNVAERGASSSSGGIPLDLLEAVDVVASLPEFTDIQEGSIPLGLRVRCLPEYCGGRTLRFLEFEVQVSQVENYRFAAILQTLFARTHYCVVDRSIHDRTFQQQFPMSPDSEQPPTLPLLSPNPFQFLAEDCQISPIVDEAGNRATKATRKHMLIPDGQMFYRPSGVALTGATGGVALDHRWARMDVVVPVLRAQQPSKQDTPEREEEDGKMHLTSEAHADRTRRRALVLPKTHSPFARVTHEMKVFIKVSWDPNEDDAPEDGGRFFDSEGPRVDRIHCIFPLHFIRIPEESRARLLSSNLASSQLSSATDIPSPRTSASAASCSPLSSLFSVPAPTPPSIISPIPSSPHKSLLASMPPAVLPAYTQLFHENGERREDDVDQYGCWLPPYSADDGTATAKRNPCMGVIACPTIL